MKKGYHSTQPKYFNTVPRSEFLGVALGYGCGLFLSGLLHYGGQWVSLGCAVIGFAVGYVVDNRYYAEQDVEEEVCEPQDDGLAQTADDAEDPPLTADEDDS